MAPLKAALAASLLFALGPSCASAPTLADERAVGSDRRLIAEPDETSEQHQAIKNFTLRVRNKSCQGLGTGSGVLIGPDTLITNRHVVTGAVEVEVETWSGFRQDATITHVRTYVDLAVVRLEAPFDDITPAPIGQPPGVGDAVRAVGYPLGGEITITSGVVTGDVAGSEVGQTGSVIEFDAPVRPGNSGGPLVNDDGEVVGVVFARNLVDNKSLAVPAAQLESVRNHTVPAERRPCS